MSDRIYPSGSTLSSPGRERHNAERVSFRICAMDDAHGEDVPFAAVVATITSPAHGTVEHPRGTWQSGIPLCQSCSDQYQREMPFGFYMVDRVLPVICQNCGLPSPCNDCDDID